MNDIDSSEVLENDDQEILYFWAVGDLHFRSDPQWDKIHTQRLASMFQDLATLWQEEGKPAFCVSPGDLVETGAPENYALAKSRILAQMPDIPFYPGIGNHEYYAEEWEETTRHTHEDFTQVWNKPNRYYWIENGILFIMLDEPDPFVPDPEIPLNPVTFTESTLDFLQTTLQQHPQHPTIIFAHCPLSNTVLDRDAEQKLDLTSQDTCFYVENSDEVRAILASHPHTGLYISGHTHSGWGSSQLIYTEQVHDHPITHVNLMSPWYTGLRGGMSKNRELATWEYTYDNPDVQASFAFHIYPQKAIIRVRNHLTQSWMAEWTVPLPFSSNE